MIGVGLRRKTAAKTSVGGRFGTAYNAVAFSTKQTLGADLPTFSAMFAICIQIHATARTLAHPIGAATHSIDTAPPFFATLRTTATMQIVEARIHARTKAQRGSTFRTACVALPACTTLAIRTSIVADPAMLVRYRRIRTSGTTRQIPERTPTHPVDADLPVSTGFVASSAMFGTTLKIDASSAAIGGCRAWAIRHTTTACAFLTTCTDLPATSAVFDICAQSDTGPVAIHRACGTHTAPLDAAFSAWTGVVTNAAVLVVLE